MYVAQMLLALVSWSFLDDLPPALDHLHRARSELRGHISVVVTGGFRHVGMPVHRFSLDVARNGDTVQTYEGDEEGVLFRDEQGAPMQVGTVSVLRRAEDMLVMSTWDGAARRCPADFDSLATPPGYPCQQFDARAIGIVADWDMLVGRTVSDAIMNVSRSHQPLADTEHVGAIHRVSLEDEAGGRIVYEIDEAKDWNATTITATRNGHTWKCVNQLERFDDKWFPRTTTITQDDRVIAEVQVVEANFTPTAIRESISPADIGLEVGTNIFPHDGSGLLIWDGTTAIPHAEARERFASGELQPGPRMLAEIDGQDPPARERVRILRTSTRVIRSAVSWWQLFVARFCRDHELNEDQCQKAFALLRESEEHAERYMAAHQTEFSKVQESVNKSPYSQKKAEAEFARLRAPVDLIFENELKSRLLRIPTRSQLAKVESAGQRTGSTTQPVQVEPKRIDDSGNR